MLEVREEDFPEVEREIRPLLMRHWHEIAMFQEQIALLPDFAKYRQAAAQGNMTIITVRAGSRLLGYAIHFQQFHLHYSQSKWGFSDIFWLDPEVRLPRVSIRLFLTMEEVLRSKGVEVMHTSAKIAHPAAGRILQHLGHVPAETGFVKWIKG